jgi:alpha-tubulin suppressor-like RCC1 family protein
MAVTPQVSAGYAHSVALKSDGTVWTWGDNSFNQLGYSVTGQSPLPQQVPGISGIIGIAAGEDHTLALDSSGNVWAWGDNTMGQLGNPNITSNAPNQIPVFSSIVAIAAGTQFSMALDKNGAVWAWGRNDFGQVGNGVLGDGINPAAGVLTPTKITALSGIKWIAAGDCHAIASNGSTASAWGCNDYGQLGDGTTVAATSTVQTPSPVPVTGLSGVTSVAAGGSNNADIYGGYSLALMSGGTVVAWGRNVAGQLGDGQNLDSPTYVPVSNLTSVTGITAGYSHSIALDSNGALWAWGDNSSGEFGNTTAGLGAGSNVPVTTFSAATPAIGCSAGYFFTLAIKADGTVWASGSNDTGQLGNGVVDQFPSTNPVPAKVLDLSLSQSVLLGDMNNSGKVTAADALLALQYSVGINTLGLTAADALARGDVNHSGKVTAADALLILQKSVGIASY